MKKFGIAFIAVLLIVLTCAAFGCDAEKYVSSGEFDATFDGLQEKPVAAIAAQADAIDTAKVVLADTETDDAAVREAAAYLWTLGNANAVKVDYYASAAEGGGVADVNVLGAVFRGNMNTREWYVRDGASWYYEGFGQVMGAESVKSDDETKDVDFLLGVIRGILEYGERQYTPDGVTMYTQRGGSKCLNSSSVDNYLKGGSVDFDQADKKSNVKYAMADFYSTYFKRNSYLEIDNALITANDIKTAKIEKKNGYYSVYIEARTDTSALDLGVQSLRKSASSKDLTYVYQKYTFDIWDCGLYKKYCTDNSWQATITMFKGSSKNVYNRYFSYDKSKAKKLVLTEAQTAFTSICK